MKYDEAEKLKGIWKGVSVQTGGDDWDATELILTVEKDTLTVKADNRVFIKGTFRLDATKTPRAIDVALTEGSWKKDGEEALGIYKIDKDSFTWCLAWPRKKERPKGFVTRAHDSHTLFTFKLEKP
jgi:uncharacterized protein (TIGR03067 family)